MDKRGGQMRCIHRQSWTSVDNIGTVPQEVILVQMSTSCNNVLLAASRIVLLKGSYFGYRSNKRAKFYTIVVTN